MQLIFFRSSVILIFFIILLGEMAGAVSRGIISPSLSLSVQNQQLTVQIDRMPLREVLETLTDQIPITITLKGFEGENTISASFTNVSLVEGIERLLQGLDYALLYGRPGSASGSSSHNRLVEIVVLPRQSSRPNSTTMETQLVISPKELNQESPEENGQTVFSRLKHQALDSSDSSDRIDALLTIADRHNNRALGVLNLAAQDRNPEVRATAIVLLASHEGTEEENLLIQTLQDSNPDIQELVQDLLEEQEVPL